MGPQQPDPAEFVAAVAPVLESRDLHALLTLLKSRWTAPQIVSLLSCKCCDARKVAALSLSLVGQPCCLNELAKRLKEADPVTAEMAEHAMWSIWFRAGPPEANHQLARGAQATARRDYPHAIHHFNKALQIKPDFAEAYNQRALAEFLMERFDESIADCERAIELMPIHFGAWAGMGHCHTHLGRFDRAIECYENALEIHPHLHPIREAVEQLRPRVESV